MKRVYTSEALADAGHFRAVLEQRGIACFIKNEQLSGAIGEVPFLECSPEVWVYDDSRADEARQIIEELTHDTPEVHAPWRCRACGETNEGQFAACWRCGASDESA
jgi:hypothetical protein